MSRRSLYILCLGICLVGISASRAAGQPAVGFVIERADEQATFGVMPSTDLNARVGNVAIHYILDRADGRANFSVTVLPGLLSTLIEQVGIHYVLDRADANLVIEQHYPALLINNQSQPPWIGLRHVNPLCRLVWTVETGEYTTLEVEYGTSPGDRPFVLRDPFFRLMHELTLPALSPGESFYVVVKVTDRNGNLTALPEAKVSGLFSTYLPAVRR